MDPGISAAAGQLQGWARRITLNSEDHIRSTLEELSPPTHPYLHHFSGPSSICKGDPTAVNDDHPDRLSS